MKIEKIRFNKFKVYTEIKISKIEVLTISKGAMEIFIANKLEKTLNNLLFEISEAGILDIISSPVILRQESLLENVTIFKVGLVVKVNILRYLKKMVREKYKKIISGIDYLIYLLKIIPNKIFQPNYFQAICKFISR